MQLLDGTAGCTIAKYEVFEDDCSTLSQDFDNADNMLPTLLGGKMKSLVKDNVNYKTYKLCIVATTENDYESKQFKETYEPREQTSILVLVREGCPLWLAGLSPRAGRPIRQQCDPAM